MEKTQVQIEFEKICAVPRYSGHNEKIIAYCIREAEALGYKTACDICGNVVIKVPAAPGKEKGTPLVLQGHLDMVAAKVPESSHDFDNDPIDVKIDGDYYYAEGTTLGADDGAAPAICFALLRDKSLNNPPLEILLTNDEEIGMLSVRDADLNFLEGRYLINLDNEEDGYFVIGCCGGTGVKLSVPVEKESVSGNRYKVRIDGLEGGHSGQEIDRQRANAIKLMGQFLFELSEITDFRLISVKAVGKDNIIANNCEAEFVAPADDAAKISGLADRLQKNFAFVYRETDKNINVKTVPLESFNGNAACKNSTDKLASVLLQLPYGVIALEQQNFSKVETSANIGVIETTESTIDITVSIRSSVDQRLEMVVNLIKDLRRTLGLEPEIVKEYPAWLPDFDSPLIEPVRNLWKKMYGTEPVFDSIHAGLECGVIMGNSRIEAAISMGPQMEAIHTVNERLSISSLNRYYDFVKALVESF